MSKLPASEEAKQRVLKVYPFAHCYPQDYGAQQRFIVADSQNWDCGSIGKSTSADAAWIDADSRLPALSEDGVGSDAKTLFVGANPSKEFERNMEGVRGIIKGLSEVLKDGPADKDNCEICRGAKGGVKGNENIIDGKSVCDYCHAAMLDGSAEGIETCRNCHTVGHTDWCRDGLDEPRPVEPAAPIVQPVEDIEDAALEMFIAERMKVAEEFGVDVGLPISRINLDGIDAEVNSRMRLRVLELQRELETIKASHPTPVVVRPEERVTLQEVYDYFMGREACGDFTCSCNKPEYCGVCDLRKRTEETLTAQPAPLPSDHTHEELLGAAKEAYASMAGNNSPFDPEVWSKSVLRLEWAIALAESKAALPVGQKETFEEWQRSPEACAIFAEYAPGFAAPMIKAAKAAWNAAKGQEETK